MEQPHIISYSLIIILSISSVNNFIGCLLFFLRHTEMKCRTEFSYIPAPPIIEFDSDGTVVQAWGGSGEGYEWPEVEHGISGFGYLEEMI